LDSKTSGITVRKITPYDYNDLQEAISKDSYHRDTTTPEFFYEPDTLGFVYGDDNGTILWLRISSNVDKIARLDIQFRRNKDARRNKAAMDWGFPILCEHAKKGGYKAFMFDSVSPHLVKYCTSQLGFKIEENNILRKELN